MKSLLSVAGTGSLKRPAKSSKQGSGGKTKQSKVTQNKNTPTASNKDFISTSSSLHDFPSWTQKLGPIEEAENVCSLKTVFLKSIKEIKSGQLNCYSKDLYWV